MKISPLILPLIMPGILHSTERSMEVRKESPESKEVLLHLMGMMTELSWLIIQDLNLGSIPFRFGFTQKRITRILPVYLEGMAGISLSGWEIRIMPPGLSFTTVLERQITPMKGSIISTLVYGTAGITSPVQMVELEGWQELMSTALLSRTTSGTSGK